MIPTQSTSDQPYHEQSSTPSSYTHPSTSPPKARRPSISLRKSSTKRRPQDKEKDRDARPSISREIGSATISLRPRAVSHLSDDEQSPLESGPSTSTSTRKGSKLSYAPPDEEAISFNGTSLGGWNDGSQPIAGPSRIPSYDRSTARPSIVSSQESSIRRSPRKTRPRAKSFQYTNPPESPSGTGDKRNFYLSHYSTDTQYSLARISTSRPSDSNSPSKPRRVIELGLGDAFDVSFGEALRRGAEGEELPLDKETLRVLNEVKDNSDLKGLGKQGRKGSIGMGLFRESRNAGKVSASAPDALPSGLLGAGAGSQKRKGVKDDVLLEESEEELHKVSKATSTRSRSTTAATIIPGSIPSDKSTTKNDRSDITGNSIIEPIPIRSAPHRPPIPDLDEGEMSAGMRIVSSPLLRDEKGHHVLTDDSAWTSSGTSSEGSDEDDEDGEGVHEEELEATDVDTDLEEEEEEEERITVPLQPFNHAVGGHSSIYKFTRRAVCKVS